MKFNQTHVYILVIIIVIGAGALFLTDKKGEQRDHQTLYTETAKPPSEYPQATVTIREHVFAAEIADTPERKSKGLGGRTDLADDYGMLFPFDDMPYPPTFWMKGMLIPLDMIWIKNNTIIQIDKNVPAEPDVSDMELKRYSPDGTVDYVLEVRAGLSDEKGFEVGDRAEVAT